MEGPGPEVPHRLGRSPFQSSGPWPSWQVETDGSARRTVRAVSSTMTSTPSACLHSHEAFSLPQALFTAHSASGHSEGSVLFWSVWTPAASLGLPTAQNMQVTH